MFTMLTFSWLAGHVIFPCMRFLYPSSGIFRINVRLYQVYSFVNDIVLSMWDFCKYSSHAVLKILQNEYNKQYVFCSLWGRQVRGKKIVELPVITYQFTVRFFCLEIDESWALEMIYTHILYTSFRIMQQMIGVFRPRFCIVRLYWAWDNLGEWDEFCYAPGAGSNARPVFQQSSALPLYHRCLLRIMQQKN